MTLSFMPSPKDLEIIKKLDMGSPWVWIATLGGLGFFRPGPGTWGSLGALPLGVLIYLAGGITGFAIAFAIFLLLGYFAARDFERQSGQHDSKMVVVDELLGLWVAMLPALVMDEVTWVHMGAAFVLFRLFDIWKPLPIKQFDRDVNGAAGVIGDDIIAGQYAAICLVGAMYAGLI